MPRTLHQECISSNGEIEHPRTPMVQIGQVPNGRKRKLLDDITNVLLQSTINSGRKRKPLVDITNVAPQSIINLEPPTPDQSSQYVKEWYNECYNNLMYSVANPYATVINVSPSTPCRMGPPTPQITACSIRDQGDLSVLQSGTKLLDSSQPWQISSVTADGMEAIVAEFIRRRDKERTRNRDRYSNMSDTAREAQLQRNRQNKQRKRRSMGNTQNVQHPNGSYESVYYNLPESHHILKPAPPCGFCEAKRFEYEPPGFCCRSGKIKIVTPMVPDELRDLFVSQDDDSKYFRDHIRHFNSHFSFTSLGVTLDRDLASSKDGIYTFRVQGQLYHKLDNLVHGDHGPRHMQLYYYDTDAELAHRANRSPNLRIDIIGKLLRIFRSNPYVETFRSLGDVPNLDDYKISLNTSITLDQRVYNAPTASQVAAIWVDGNDPQNCFDRSVQVYGRDGKQKYIRPYYGCYDPLSYPLFYPAGEIGWNRYMSYVGAPLNEHPYHDLAAAGYQDEAQDEGSTSYVSAREYYCFKLQVLYVKRV